MASVRRSYLIDALPGIVLGLVTRYQEIQKCLMSDCESWVLKSEKILLHIGFILGFASPSRLVWQILRELLTKVSFPIAEFLDGHPGFEGRMRMAVSLLEYIGLAQIWDFVRDSSICMRFHNCDSEFFGQLSNIKIKQCGLLDMENWNDDWRPLSICEKLFNDSPLVMLAVGMVILAVVADGELKVPEPQGPDDRPAQIKVPTPVAVPPISPKKSKSKNNTPSSSPSKPTKRGKGGTGSETSKLYNGVDGDKDASNSFVSNAPNEPDPPPDSDKNGTDKDSPDGIDKDKKLDDTDKNEEPSGGTDTDALSSSPDESPIKDTKSKASKPAQVVHGKCPNCSKLFHKTVPKPWPICCSKKEELTKSQENHKDRTKAIKKSFPKKTIAVDKVVKILFHDIKCKVCREKIKRSLEKFLKKSDSKSKSASKRKKCKKPK